MQRFIALTTRPFVLALLGSLSPCLVTAAVSHEEALSAAIDGEWRSDEDRARDAERHPAASLNFWGLKPGMTILEVQPGGGAWWTGILAPYARMTGGEYYATGADLDDRELSDNSRAARKAFEQRFGAQPDVYGKINVVNWGKQSKPLPANKFDFILTARSVHGWMQQDVVERVFKDLYAALKPGGILALEQHRANPGPQDPKARSGYVTEEYVIEQARKAGFDLAGRSEINANPKDTKDYPFGVWTLPPARRTSPYGQPDDPTFDRTKYDTIGESDRMTLKFVKPK